SIEGVCNFALDAYNSSNKDLRIYANSALTITPAEGVIIQQIKFTNTNNKATTITLGSTDGSIATANKVTTWTGSTKAAVVIKTSGQIRVNYIEVTYEKDSKRFAEISYDVTEVNAELGEEFTAPKLVNPNGLDVEYTSSNPAVATVDAEGAVQLLASGVTTITATSMETDEYNQGQASYVLSVMPKGTVMDVLTATTLGIIPNAAYSQYSYISPVTNIEYKAQAYSAKGEHFQIKTSEGKSGIVVTKNDEGYMIREVLVEWAVPGMSGTQVDVYVNDKAYTAPSQLHSTTTQGTLAGSIVKGENLPVMIDEDACYMGIRSKDGVVQLHSIYVIWEKAPVKPAAPEVVVNEAENTITVTVDEGCTAFYKYTVVSGEEAPEAFDLEADTWYPVENNTIDLSQLPRTTGDEKIELTVKAVSADGAESDLHTTTFANPGGVSAIADVELGQSAETIYYNLQGVRMEGALAPGLYIRSQGGKATKVVVK
ncbi:MAG: Ig-like domain-containing protein, partial [Muribaculaceae bacterium]|nr:Ig-like domain-containing protein [Muribaculaceae bacterium]